MSEAEGWAVEAGRPCREGLCVSGSSFLLVLLPVMLHVKVTTEGCNNIFCYYVGLNKRLALFSQGYDRPTTYNRHS